jgi:hypothetical protein
MKKKLGIKAKVSHTTTVSAGCGRNNQNLCGARHKM